MSWVAAGQHPPQKAVSHIGRCTPPMQGAGIVISQHCHTPHPVCKVPSTHLGIDTLLLGGPILALGLAVRQRRPVLGGADIQVSPIVHKQVDHLNAWQERQQDAEARKETSTAQGSETQSSRDAWRNTPSLLWLAAARAVVVKPAGQEPSSRAARRCASPAPPCPAHRHRCPRRE
jgi:hypothetical protein